MRVLILTYFFPPYNTVGAVRVGKHAKYLHKHGHDIRVITAADDVHSTWLRPTLPIEFPEECVIWVDPSLARFRIGRHGSAHWLWSGPAFDAAISSMRGWSPDVILACALPVSALLVARRLSARWHVPWVAEFRDLWADNHTYSRTRRFLLNLLERPLLRTTRALVTVSGPLAQTLQEKYQRPTAVVTNGFDRCDYPPLTKPPSGDGVVRVPLRRLDLLWKARSRASCSGVETPWPFGGSGEHHIPW